MKIGDKVRFLDSIGGGIITGFEGRDIVLVEDEDGFDIPVLRHNCVVVDSDQEQRIKDHSPIPKKTNTTSTPDSEPEPEPADRPITFRPSTQERKGGDKLNIFLCFAPTNTNPGAVLHNTSYDAYIINDSNYYINYTFLSGENSIWLLRHIDTVEPNTKVFIQNIEATQLNDFQNICFQILAYKEDRTFALKEPLSIELRLDLIRFHKPHLFEPNDFFSTPVLTLPLVENDQNVGSPRKIMEDHLQTLTNRGQSPSVKQTSPASSSPQTPIVRTNRDGDEVVDLHAAELLDTMQGMSPNDILEYQLDVFRTKMAEFSKIKGKRIVFIHGKGEGVLRNRINQILKQKYPRCNWQDASFREYGFGATLVIIH